MSALAKPWQAAGGQLARGVDAVDADVTAPHDARDRSQAQGPGDAEDRALLAEVARGDRASLARLYRRYDRQIFGYLLRQLGDDPALAEEALQDVMLAVWTGASAYRADSRVLTWLFGIAHRKALQARRHARRRPALWSGPRSGRSEAAAGPAASLSPDARLEAERRLTGGELREAIARLPDGLAVVLELTLYQGLSTVETGAVLGLPSGTVKSRLSRARARLRSALEEERNP
ncbi:MAG: sigma-70 family RNA polymerase sigma factor [Chloroflexi bacterium]|nr:sigma-70 family RNA polymerase sigma factor [Chloroflexota bacterium]